MVRLLALALLAPVVLLATPGCAAWRGARLYQSGTRALERGEVDRALDDLQHAAQLVPAASEIQNHLGIAWLEAGDDAAALRAFQRAVDLDCDNRAARDNLTQLEARLQRAEREAAIDRLSAPAVSSSPESPDRSDPQSAEAPRAGDTAAAAAERGSAPREVRPQQLRPEGGANGAIRE